MVNSVLILSPSRYCTTTTTTNSTRCGIYSVWFRVLSFGFWGVGVRWLIHLILSPSRYCTTLPPQPNTMWNIYLFIYLYFDRAHPRPYIYFNVIAHPPLRRSNGRYRVLCEHVAVSGDDATGGVLSSWLAGRPRLAVYGRGG